MIHIKKFPCPCCGFLVHDSVGSSAICEICRWEDDVVQLRWPDYQGGANRLSLIESQRNYQRLGAVNEEFVARVRAPRTNEGRDTGFRYADPEIDNFEPSGDASGNWPSDYEVLYWWRPTYWRR
ncbi:MULTISPECIES: CPCC family cysteine-rich protein [Glycomyces]|uniref:Cysteine-rich CPCC domain-containing protein n=1 Tax=Glycomyces rutgersensis TaxID=58115 RepID=A0ABN3F612_9ACTN